MDTRAFLLDSAEHLVRTRGFDGFSYADLSDAVGIRKASIHYHFPTKSELSVALITRYRETFFARLAEIEAAQANAGSRLRAYLETYRNALQGGESVCLCVAFTAARFGLDPAVLSEIRRFTADSIDWLERLFRRAIADGTVQAVQDAGAEAAACLALVEGAQLVARAAQDVARFDTSTAILGRRIA